MKEIGTYYPMDEGGRVLNRAKLENILPPWDEVVAALMECYEEKLGDQLHSVWLRGSVVAGTAVPDVSDLDSFAFVQRLGEKKWEKPAWGQAASDKLTRQFPFVTEIEFVLSSWGADFADKYPQLLPMMKTQAIQIGGEVVDLPGKQPLLADLKRNGRWIQEDWEAFLARLDNSEHMRTFIKTFIRGAFEEVMEKEGKYATDFHPCVESIAFYRPDWQEKLVEMVDIFCEPWGKGGRLRDIASGMVDEIRKKTAF